MVGDLTDTAPHTGDRSMCVCETPSVFMLCCMKSGTKCKTEHVFGKCSEYLYYATAVTHYQIISHCLWGLKVELNQSPD